MVQVGLAFAGLLRRTGVLLGPTSLDDVVQQFALVGVEPGDELLRGRLVPDAQ